MLENNRNISKIKECIYFIKWGKIRQRNSVHKGWVMYMSTFGLFKENSYITNIQSPKKIILWSNDKFHFC